MTDEYIGGGPLFEVVPSETTDMKNLGVYFLMMMCDIASFLLCGSKGLVWVLIPLVLAAAATFAYIIYIIYSILSGGRRIAVYESFMFSGGGKIPLESIRYAKISEFGVIKVIAHGKTAVRVNTLDKNADRLLEWIKAHRIPLCDNRNEIDRNTIIKVKD